MKLPFDERSLINDNLPYILRALKLDSLAAQLASDPLAVAGVTANVDVSQAHPGSPVPVFRMAG